MSLDIWVAKYLGSLVTVEPLAGEGWAGGDPGSFRMELWELARNGGAYAGGYGLVREPGHAFDNLKVVFNARLDEGRWNFDSSPGDYNVWLYRALPAAWREIATRGKPADAAPSHSASGTAVIGVNRGLARA